MHPFHTLIRKVGIALLLGLSVALSGILPAAHATESWVGTGAPGQGGLVRGLYLQPNTSPTKLLAAAYGSGIFMSTDGGTTWAPSNAGLVSKRVRQVRGQPITTGSPAWILAATEGGGMYRSTDGGATWSASNTGLQCLVVNSFGVFNSATGSIYGDADTVYAGTGCATNSGVYKSTNGGVTWNKIDWSGLGVTAASVGAITVAGTTAGQIIWASSEGQGLFRSVDGGVTWLRRNGTNPNILSGPNGSGNSAYVITVRQGSGFVLASVKGGGIFRSVDSGGNWTAVNTGLPINPTILNGPISNISGSQYVAVAGLGFYKNTITSTSVPSWTFFAGPAQGLPAMVRSIDDDPTTSTTWYATTFAGVYRSLDSGASWSPIINGLGGGHAHSSTTDPNNPNVVLGAADAMYRSTDGGVTWVKSSAGLTDRPRTPRFARGQANVALVSTADAGVFKTTDGGFTWFPSNTGLPAAPDLVGMDARVRVDPIVNGLFYVMLEGRGVYKSSDYGSTWSAVNSGLTGLALEAQALGIDPSNSSRLYLTTAGGYYRSVDAGASWSLMPGLPTSGIEAGQVNVDPNNSAVAYAAASIPDTSAGPAASSGVWKTTDFGNTWTQVLLNKLARRIVVVGAGGYTSIYVGAWDDTGGGILKSVDGGATWTQVNTGLTSNYARGFEHSSDRRQFLRASFAGGGIMNFANGVDAAVAGVAAALDSFKNIVNTQGINLDYTHLLPGYDAGYLSGGRNATQDAKRFASDIRGDTVTGITITKVNSYDDVTGIINVAGTATVGGVTEYFDGNNEDFGIFKRQGDGSYKLYGDQRIAGVGVQVEMRTDYSPGFNVGPRQHVNFHINAPVGVLSTAANAHTATALPNNWSPALPQFLTTGSIQNEIVQGSPPPAPADTFTSQAFYGGFDTSPTSVTSGTVFQFTLTKADASQVTYSVPFVGTALTNTVTGAITNVTINGSTATSFPLSTLSLPLNLAWTLPTGYAIQNVQLYGYVQNSNNEQCSTVFAGDLPGTATSGQLTLPSTCGSSAIVRGGINVTTNGFNGERSQFIYGFNITTAGNVNLTITHQGPNTVATGISPLGYVCNPTTNPGTCVFSIPSGTALTLSASSPAPSTPGIFSGGTGSAAGCATSTCSFTLTTNSALTVTGDSALGPFPTLTITLAGSGTGQVTSPTNATTTAWASGSVVNLSATPAAGSTFGGFSGACVSGTTTCSFTITGNSSVTATFTASPVLALSTFGPISVQEGGTATFGAYLLRSNNVTQTVNATWSGGSPASLSSSGVLTVGTNAVTANTGTTLTATFSDPTLTGGQTVTTSRAVIIQDGTDHWVGNNQPGQGGDIRQILTISDGGATTLVALVYGRGVWRSTNNGATWLPANIGLGERQVRSVTLLPDGTNNTLALATEAGVYRSVTRGGSWVSSNTGLGSCTNARVIARKDASIVYLGTNNCGVYKSSDGGVSWTAVNNGLPASTAVNSLSVSSTSDFVAIGTAGAGFYRSLDGGANWSAMNNGLVAGPNGGLVTRILTDPSFYLASVEGSGIFRSTDGGANWSLITNGAPTGASYGPFLRFTGSSDIYVGAAGFGTFKSVDNGVSWTQIPVSGVARRRTGPIPDPNVAGTLYFLTAAGIYKSVDSGSTWSKASNGLPGGFTQGISTDPGNPSIVLAVADTVYKSTDGGTTWAPSNSGLTGHSATNPGSINGTVNGGGLLRNSSGLFVTTTDYGVFKSTDNGATWSAANIGLPPLVGQGPFVRPDATNTSGLFATFGNYPNGAYRSADGGTSWQSINGDLAGNALYVRFVAADPNAPGTLYAATRAGLYKSVNGGTNWTLVLNSSTCGPSRVRVDAGTNPSTIYWSGNCGEQTAASGLYRSTDGGATSTQLLSFEPIFDVRAVRNAGALTLWVSTWKEPGYFTSTNSLTWVGRIIRSTDGGTTWTGVNAGLLPVRPRGFEVNSTGSQVLHVSTGGAGIYTFVAGATVDTVAPTVPGGFTATPASSSQINLAWSASTDNVGVTIYQVFRNGVQVGTVNSPTLSFNDTGLAASTLYNYGVNACDAAGNCSAQATASATTQSGVDTQAPSVPTGLTANAVSSSQINLAWNAASDNVGVSAYQVFRGGVQVATTNSATLSFNDTGLAASTLYNYGVRACDAAGNCSAQATASATTQAAVAGTPTLFTRFGAPNVSNSVRQGQTASYRAVLVKADGTIVDSVAASWSITSGPATVDINGVVTGGTVSVNTPATLVASFTDAVLTGGVTLTSTRTLTIQASQDHWTGGTTPAQGGDVRTFASVGSGTDVVIGIFGGGIRRTSDGVNWTQSGYGIPFFGSARVRALRIVPNTSNMQVLAAVEGSGIYRSSNAGASWTLSNTGMGCNFPRGFGARAATNTLYVAANCGVYKSLDDGNTWTSTALTQPVSSVVAFANSNTVWAVTFGNGLYRSTDAGATWLPASTGLPNMQVYSFDSRGGVTLAMVEGAGIYRSPNGTGTDWVTQISGLPASYGFQSGIGFQSGDGYFYVSVEGYGIFRGTTGANTSDPVTWTAWGNTASQLPMKSRTPALISDNYYVGTGQGVFKSSDNGVNWTKVSAGLPGGFTRSSVTDPTNTNVVYASADTVYKSTDGGASWAKSDSGITSAIGGQRGSGGTILRRGDGALYMNTSNAGIFKSTNGATSWFPVNSGLPTLVGQGVTVRGGLNSAPQTLYALFGEDLHGVYRTLDGGATWSSITGDLPAGNARYTNTIATDLATGDLYLGTDAGLYKSANGGTTWTPVYTSQPVYTVRVDTGTTPSNVYFSTYVANSFNSPQAASGLYRSAGGAAPTQILSGYLVRNFRVLRPGGALTLYVSSWNLDNATQGVLKSTDGGTTWYTINSGLNNRMVNSFDPVNQEIVHASTFGDGVYNFVPPPTPTPSVPTGVTANLSGSNNIVISWNAVSGATGYNIYMANQSGVTKANYLSLAGGHIHANVTSPYTDASAAPGTYYLVVTALSASGESVESSQVSITVSGDIQAPSVPTGLNISNLNSTSLTFSWSASSDNVGVTQYKIYRGGPLLTTLTGAPPATTYNDSGLTANTTYSYTVQACDGAGNCSAQSAPASAITPPVGSQSFTANLEPGFNLIGNSLNLTINVASTFGNADAPVAGVTSNVVTIWKWVVVEGTGRWAFYSPQLNAAGIASFAASKGYDVLATINAGEGYWVNAATQMALPTQSGTAFNWNGFNFAALPLGFNLIAHANTATPSQFNVVVSETPPSPGVISTGNFLSLWAWDAVQANWYFYSPLLESSGGLAGVKSYADSRFYLHFQDFGKTLGIGTGFWVNRP